MSVTNRLKFVLWLCLLLATSAQAGVTVVDSTTIALRRGSTNVTPAPSDAADCRTKKAAAIAAESAGGRTSGSTSYSCIITEKSVATFNADPPPPPEPPAETWTRCAGEGELCPYTGTRRSRLGVDTRWRVLEQAAVNGGVMCRNSVFGGDPAPGVVKACYLSSVALTPAPTPEPPPPPPTGTATLSWTPPTTNTDGSTLTDLVGYRVVYGPTPTQLVSSIDVREPGISSYALDKLAPGTYYFAVRALTTTGVSEPSNVVTKFIL